MEIGGYIEFEKYHRSMLHDDGLKLNCGRNALAYVIQAKGIKRLWMPKFLCGSCNRILVENDVQVKYYSVGIDFKPLNIARNSGEWLYLVNYYGQLNGKDIQSYGENVICDNAQAYFEEPIQGIDTLYTCRKYFGVADGAILYTDKPLQRELPQDESFGRMHFLLGRYERTASEFYHEYVDNNYLFANEPIKQMSRLTENLLHGIDYNVVERRRTENFSYLHEQLSCFNKLKLRVPEGAFMYPLYIENGATVRKKLQEKKIYIPTLWPDVFEVCDEKELEYDMAKNILPLPVDQRYDEGNMNYICKEVVRCITD